MLPNFLQWMRPTLKQASHDEEESEDPSMHVRRRGVGSNMRDGTQLVVEDIMPFDAEFSRIVHRDKSDDGGLYVKDPMFNTGRPIPTVYPPTTWRKKPSETPYQTS